MANAGLFVLTLLFFIGPAWGQEEAPKAPNAQVETQTQAPSEKNPNPQATKQPETTPSDRPQTIGEYFTGQGGTDSNPESQDQAKPEAAVPEAKAPSEKLNWPEKVDHGEHWATRPDVGQSTFFDKLIQVTWSLGLICLLVWASAKLAGKAGLKQLGVATGGSKSLIQVLEKKRFSPGRSIMVVKVGPKVLAVAATEGGYETLTEFDSEEFARYQDAHGLADPVEMEEPPPDAVQTPADIARHYLSIIPGAGNKK